MTKEELDRGRDGKTISTSGQGWALPTPLAQMTTGQDGKDLLRSHLLCPNDLERLLDRLD